MGETEGFRRCCTIMSGSRRGGDRGRFALMPFPSASGAVTGFRAAQDPDCARLFQKEYTLSCLIVVDSNQLLLWSAFCK